MFVLFEIMHTITTIVNRLNHASQLLRQGLSFFFLIKKLAVNVYLSGKVVDIGYCPEVANGDYHTCLFLLEQI